MANLLARLRTRGCERVAAGPDSGSPCEHPQRDWAPVALTVSVPLDRRFGHAMKTLVGIFGAALAACSAGTGGKAMPDLVDGSPGAIVGNHDAGGELCCLNASALCVPATPCNGEIAGQPVAFSCDELSGPLIDCRDQACQVLGEVCISFEEGITCTGTIGACPASCAWPASGSPFTCP
jgi:hypothetical protein